MVWVVAHVGVAVLVYRHVPEPYMVQQQATPTQATQDEEFHVGQAARYCQGHWDQWDPKITTFPGLYIVAVPWLRILDLTGGGLCNSVLVMRLLNVLFGLGNLWILNRLCHLLHPGDHHNTLRAFVLSLFPVLYFFNFLFYTDPGATFFVLLMYYCVKKRQYSWSALAALCSLAFRQTNIIWIAFTCITAVLDMYDDAVKKKDNPNTHCT